MVLSQSMIIFWYQSLCYLLALERVLETTRPLVHVSCIYMFCVLYGDWCCFAGRG